MTAVHARFMIETLDCKRIDAEIIYPLPFVVLRSRYGSGDVTRCR
jgi:hypothetical protein